MMSKNAVVHISAEGFVDDISLFINNPELHDMQALDLIYAAVLVHDINVWQDHLADGPSSKLELDKWFYYILAWKFNKFGNTIPQFIDDIQSEQRPCVDILDPDTRRQVSITMKDYQESHQRTLGVYKNMSGIEKDQVQALMDKSIKFAVQTALGQLTWFQARRAYSAIYIPAMTYRLVATSIPECELYAIQA